VRTTRETSSQTATKAIKYVKDRREREEGRDVVLPSSLSRLKQEEGYLLCNKGKRQEGGDLLEEGSKLASKCE
jgi:hypothetical protein